METTVSAVSIGWMPSMRLVVNYFRQWWVNRENVRLEKNFEAENGRAPSGDERIELMQRRIDYFRGVGLR